MMKIYDKKLAYPYFVWMVLFTVVPLIIVVYYAFTDANGAFQIYVRPEVAEKVIAISKSFNIDAQIVGHIEEGKRSLTIKSEFGTFEY